MTNAIPSLYVSPEQAAEIDASQDFNFKRPTDATQKGFGAKASFSWTELIEIKGSEIVVDDTDEDMLIFKPNFKIPDDSPYPTNLGRATTPWYRVKRSLMGKAGNEKDVVQTRINAAKLRQIARAAGCVTEGEGFDYTGTFNTTDEAQAPVVGARIYCTVVEKPGKRRDGTDAMFQELTKFIPEGETA